MPIFTSEPATTVRQHSPWLPPKVAYGAVFLTVAAAACGWKFYTSSPLKIDVPGQATAKVCIHLPDFAFQHAWQEILAQARTEVRENLHMQAQRFNQQTVVAISLSDLPAETIVPMTNLVASAYAQACRADWRLNREQAYSAASEKVRQTERQAIEAQTRFELLRDCRLQAMANAKPLAPPQPTTIENPRWTEVSHRLADLEQRKRTLLLERTQLHPSVQEIELRIADVRRELASIPAEIAREAPAESLPSTPPPDVPALAEVETAQQSMERLRQELQQAQAVERAALTARSVELQIDLVAAEPLPSPPAPRRITATTIGKSLVLATTSLVGMAMISVGASLEPALSSIAELQSLLPVPIVGVIPATHPGRRSPSSALHRRLARWGWIAAGLGVLCAVAWLFFHG